MRDGLYEMVRDLAAGDAAAELRVSVAHAMLMDAARLVLLPPGEREPATHALHPSHGEQPDVERVGERPARAGGRQCGHAPGRERPPRHAQRRGLGAA